MRDAHCRPQSALAWPAGFGAGASLLLRRDLLPGARAHQAVDDDAVVGREAVLDDAQAVVDLAQRHVFLPHDVVVIDDEDVFARLLGADGVVRHQQRLVGRRARHADAGEHAGREQSVAVVEYGAAADRAGGAVDDVVDEIHLAGVHEVVLVDQLERDGDAALAARHVLARGGEALVAQIRRLIEGELEADRIDRHDGRQQRGVAAGAARHQIADRDAAVADAAVDRRAQLGEFVEVKLGRLHHRLLRGHGGFGDALGLRALVVGLFGDGLVVAQQLAAGEIGLGEGEIGARLRQIGAHLLEHDLERTAVDGEEQVALLDHLAVGEMDGREIARHPRAHLDRVDGHEAADILVLIDDGALHRLGDRHGRRRRRGRLLLAALAAAGERKDRQAGGETRQAPIGARRTA